MWGVLEFLALIGVSQPGPPALGTKRSQPPHRTPGVPRHGDTAVRIERHAIRTGLRSFVRLGSFISAGMHENRWALPRNQLNDVVRRNFSKKQTVVACPDRPFCPLIVAGSHPLNRCVGRNDVIEGGAEFQYLLRERRFTASTEYQR